MASSEFVTLFQLLFALLEGQIGYIKFELIDLETNAYYFKIKLKGEAFSNNYFYKNSMKASSPKVLKECKIILF